MEITLNAVRGSLQSVCLFLNDFSVTQMVLGKNSTAVLSNQQIINFVLLVGITVVKILA